MKQDIRIYLVGNDELNSKRLHRMLEKEEYIEVIGHYYHADEALYRVEIDSPDIVVMDYQLPGMNGIDIARYLKRNRLDYNVGIIIVVESVDDLYINLGDDTVDYYYTKDRDLAELVEAIKQVYRNKHLPKAYHAFIETTVELIIHPVANSDELMGFIYQMEKVFRDTHSFARIHSTMGSAKSGTCITILTRPSMVSALSGILSNMPSVETLEEEIPTGGLLSRLTSKFKALPVSNTGFGKRICITVKETALTR